MIFCRLKILGRTATWKEKLVLGGARFFDDITITHSDSDYFQKHYETKFDPELCANAETKTQEEQIAFAKGELQGVDGEPTGYRPMYCMYSLEHFNYFQAILDVMKSYSSKKGSRRVNLIWLKQFICPLPPVLLFPQN